MHVCKAFAIMWRTVCCCLPAASAVMWPVGITFWQTKSSNRLTLPRCLAASALLSSKTCMHGTQCCVLPRWQGFPLQQRLLEYRCGRYFYVESADTFMPVPEVPKTFNDQLQASATKLAATQDPRYEAVRGDQA